MARVQVYVHLEHVERWKSSMSIFAFSGLFLRVIAAQRLKDYKLFSCSFKKRKNERKKSSHGAAAVVGCVRVAAADLCTKDKETADNLGSSPLV